MKGGPKNIYLLFVGIGLELVGIEVGMILLGQWVDERWGLPGVGVAVLGLGGLIVWLWHVVRMLRQLDEDETDPPARP